MDDGRHLTICPSQQQYLAMIQDAIAIMKIIPNSDEVTNSYISRALIQKHGCERIVSDDFKLLSDVRDGYAVVTDGTHTGYTAMEILVRYLNAVASWKAAHNGD